VPRYEWKSTRPRVQKCIFCAPRLEKGLQTACAEACPTGATKFGDREDLLLEAQKRINAGGGKYVTKIYGQHEVGGTSVLYLSPTPFELMGFDTRLGDSPMPLLTMNALSKVPNVAAVGGTLLAGIWWITKRREDVHKAEHSVTTHGQDEK
jgi:formate dehydrogenase iron-sulfur subunit